ncbi:MAG: sialate O-acetylesterase [Bacteroidota bacterium]
MRYLLICLLGLLGTLIPAQAKVSLPSIFSNGMVLQQQAYVSIWGRAQPGEAVEVLASWEAFSLTTYADTKGKWLVQIPTPKAGGPFTLSIRGQNTIVLRDIWIGEVWIASGQSNMEWPLAQCAEGPREIARAKAPLLRFFQVEHAFSSTPRFDAKGQWRSIDPRTALNVSGVGYFFAQALQASLKVPIGIVQATWGGTPVEAWTDRDAMESDPAFRKLLNDFDASLRRYRENPALKDPINQLAPGSLYNGMIAPLVPYACRGVIWYQGEANTKDPEAYADFFPALIKNWRTAWKQPMPFYFVQLAPFRYAGARVGVGVRESQRQSLSVPQTGMVVSMDVGNVEDIHPRRKKPIGLRLADLALHRQYGKEDRPLSGPLYQGFKVEGNRLRLSFAHAEAGLKIVKGGTARFEVAGANRAFFPAKVSIDKNELILSHPQVPVPVAARYGFEDTATAVLFNQQDLPASSFRTDDWPIFYQKPLIRSRYVKARKQYEVRIDWTGDQDAEIRYTLDGSMPEQRAQLYEGPFFLDDPVVIQARPFRRGEKPDWVVRQQLVFHAGMLVTMEKMAPGHPQYPAVSQQVLLDGQLGSTDFTDRTWVGYRQKEVEFVIDLEGKREIQETQLRFLREQGAWIFVPKNIEVTGSKNGKRFKKPSTFAFDPLSQQAGRKVVEVDMPVKGGKVRYIKIRVQGWAEIPAFHPGKGAVPWIFMDEILLR